MRRLIAALTVAALLVACDAQRIEELVPGSSTESDVRKQFGEPVQIVERADGSKSLEYPRQPEGWTNYRMTIAADGKLATIEQLLTAENFAKVGPGMGQEDVRRLLGRPARTRNYALKPGEEHWDWRFMDGQVKKVFTVSFGAEQRVVSTATGEDIKDTHTGG